MTDAEPVKCEGCAKGLPLQGRKHLYYGFLGSRCDALEPTPSEALEEKRAHEMIDRLRDKAEREFDDTVLASLRRLHDAGRLSFLCDHE